MITASPDGRRSLADPDGLSTRVGRGVRGRPGLRGKPRPGGPPGGD